MLLDSIKNKTVWTKRTKIRHNIVKLYIVEPLIWWNSKKSLSVVPGIVLLTTLSPYTVKIQTAGHYVSMTK